MEKPPRIKKIKVAESGSEMNVFIPETGDKSYDDYLEEAETEKTKDQLKKKARKSKTIVSQEQIGGAIKEYQEWVRRKKRGDTRKYF